MGRVLGPLKPLSGFHGAGPVRRALGMRRDMTVKASVSSSRARCRTETVVQSAAERLYRWGAVAGDVEAVGFVVDGGIAVAGPGGDDDLCPGGDDDPGEFDILDGGAQDAKGDRGMARSLLDGVDRQLGMLAQQCPLVGCRTGRAPRQRAGFGSCQCRPSACMV